MHPLNRLGAAVFALALLIGVPYALLWHAAWPETLPSWEIALAHLRGWRLPPGVAAAALITALWALWGLFALALAAETVARLRGVPLRLRPFGPLQAIAATAVAATAAAPAAAFADTVVQEDGTREEQAPDREGGAPDAPRAEQGPVERTRTVSGFAVGSAELTERMREDLAPTVEMLGEHWDENVPVTITGHTDPSGNADRNQELSQERAQAVADYLEEELGEDAPDTEVEGRGSDQPVEGPAESQRRVEIAYTLAPAPAAAPQSQAGDGPEEAGATADGGDGAAIAQEAARSVITVENAASVEEDGPRVVVLEIPDGAVAGVVGFAGLAGGYLLGKRGSFVPRMALSLPRRITGRPRRLALPPVPPRPEPGDDIDERVTVELDHVPGLGLTGKGADGAARRLIANALDPSEPLAVRVLITEDEAVRLLGGTGRDLLRDHPCEPVTLVPTTEDALAVLAAELHTMAEEDRAPLALIISAPDARHEHALSGLLLHGQHRGITAVVLGSWPLGGSCAVDEDGLISQTSQPLATLFHCSWPGSTAEEVHEAVRAHHAADHSASERPAAPSRSRGSAERRPVLVAEDWDDDDAFVSVGDAAAWDRLTRAWEEEAGPGDEEFGGFHGAQEPEAAPDDGSSVDAAFRALREGEYGPTGAEGTAHLPEAERIGAEDHDDSWWDETPVAETPGTDSGRGAPADRASTGEGAVSEADSAASQAAGTDTAAAPEPEGAVRHRPAAPEAASGEATRRAVPPEPARSEGDAAPAGPGGETPDAAGAPVPAARDGGDSAEPSGSVGAAEASAVPDGGTGGAVDAPAGAHGATPDAGGTAASAGAVGEDTAAAPAGDAGGPAASPAGAHEETPDAAAAPVTAARGGGDSADSDGPAGGAASPEPEGAAVPVGAPGEPATAPAGAHEETPDAGSADASADGRAARDEHPGSATGAVSPGPAAPSAGVGDAFAALTGDARVTGPTGGGPASGAAPTPDAEPGTASSGSPAPGTSSAGAPAAVPGGRPGGGGSAAAPARPAKPAAPAEEQRTRVRHERVPGRKAGRVRVVRVDRPVPGEAEPPAGPTPARPAEARSGRAARASAAAPARPRREEAVRDAAPQRETVPVPVDEGEASPAYRPQPAKPRKAGRGRTWRPRDDA
ncbi:hypothetical protein SUDANB121_00997 [Nocardiopsis dassonvillei]|uniref:OmpA family protein n=1 Tax=Nocardiopsis dassonvillei TaxID=2014 RepID=UPI003F554BFB